MANRRTDCVICTKVPPSLPPKKKGEGGERSVFTKKYLSDQLENSLRRLQTDYIDLYLLHSPDGRSDWEEICASMDQLKVTGKIRYWGLLNHDAERVESCISTARRLGVSGPVVLEEYYTIAVYALSDAGQSRVLKLEQELFPVARNNSLGVMADSPLDGGNLSKHAKTKSQSAMAILHDALDQAAVELDISRAQVCVAWVISHQEVLAVLSGPEQPGHVDEVLAGLNVTLPSEILNSLNGASMTYTNRIEAESR
ncbi:MAG: aldo/keto reductase [Gemmatimonadota bacterium]|nr:aldo/keto reductase [Gemmatimonadota bacterium]